MWMEFLKNIFGYDSNSLLLFTGISFWIFFGIILFVFSFIHAKPGRRNLLLFLSSLFFYYKCGGGFIILLFIAIVIEIGMF